MALKNNWLARLDSNQGMTESKSVALPLGYGPTFLVEGDGFEPPNP
jgi:hypothetical protein